MALPNMPKLVSKNWDKKDSHTLAVAKDEAVAMVDSGRRDLAAAKIREKAEELRSVGAAYGNSALQKAAAPAAAEADRVEKEGLGNAKRKIYRAENAATRAQQATSSR